MPNATMMRCGHAANAICTASHGINFDPPIPCCAICDCLAVADQQPDLSDRRALCLQCGTRLVPSEPGKLAFFAHRPDRDYDGYYCGCRGWD